MRSTPGRFLLSAISLICLVVLTACNNCAPVLRYLSISPLTASIDAGTTQQFSATAYYSDGTKKDVTTSARWSSSNTAVATIDPNTGVATGLTAGTTTISSSLVGPSVTATLTVVRQLVSIAVIPATATVAPGGTQQYMAMGTYKNAAGMLLPPVDISSLVTWASSNSAVSISTSGLATVASTGTGTSNITATLGSIVSPPAVLTISGLGVTGIMVSPSTKTIATTNTFDLTAVEVLSDSSTRPPVGTVTWADTCTSGSVNLVPSGTNGIEIAVGKTVGTCTVTAADGTFTQSATVTIVAAAARYGYVPSAGTANEINQWSVNVSSTTPLMPLTPATVIASVPTELALHPNGLYAYSINSTSVITIFDIGVGTGLLKLRTGVSTAAGSGGVNAERIDPTGRFLYVTDDGTATIPATTGTIDGFTISPVDGTLTPIAAVTNFSTNIQTPEDVLIDEQGKYLYIVNSTSPGSVAAYSIDQTSGALTSLGTPYAVGNAPFFATIDSSNPAKPNIFVPNTADTPSSISAFTMDPTTGLLTHVGSGPTSVTGSSALEAVVVDPTGKYLYVVDAGKSPGEVYGFNLNSGGVIGTAIGGLPQPSGTGAGRITIDPTGVLLAIDNNISNDIWLYKVTTSNGTLAPYSPPTSAANGPFGFVFYVAP